MAILNLDLAEPFYTVQQISDEPRHSIAGKSIILNLSETPVLIEAQKIGHLQSALVRECTLRNLTNAVIIGGIDSHPDQDALFARIRATWPTAYEMRREERLRGVSHFMSPKIWVGRYGFTFYHCGSVPLNVGLHREHEFCPVPGFREIHTQIAGFGKMQQCRERNIGTLYLEEPMAPGTTHRPMFDTAGNFPWHQFETITPSVLMAVEMLPEGAMVPNGQTRLVP